MQAEPVATDALTYLLGRSPAGQVAMANLVNEVHPGADVTSLSFTSQVVGESGDMSRPDLLGSDDQGVRLVVEAKFDAELTEAQLTDSYVNRLAPDLPGVLMFLVPQDRLAVLWPSLLAGPGDVQQAPPIDLRHADAPFLMHPLASKAGADRVLVAYTWERLLARLREALTTAAESANVSDLDQLAGLVSWRTSTGWTPLLPGDLPERAGRQLDALIPAVLTAAAHAAQANQHKAIASSGDLGSGRYIFSHGGRKVWVGIWFRWWSNYGISPVWAQIHELPTQPVALIAQKLRESEPLVYPVHSSHHVLVPIIIPYGAEVGEVSTFLASSFNRILAKLDELGPLAEAEPAEEETLLVDPGTDLPPGPVG